MGDLEQSHSRVTVCTGRVEEVKLKLGVEAASQEPPRWYDVDAQGGRASRQERRN